MKVHFISGLPRSGSTLLTNILAQNPGFHVSGTSGLCKMLVESRNRWDQIDDFRSMNHEESEKRKIGFLRGAFHGFFAPHREKVCFDKSRDWLGHMELIEAVLVPPPCKVIVCIRDIRDVLASLEKLWRKVSCLYQVPAERDNYNDFQTLPGRLKVWTNWDGLVGLPYNRIMDAARRGFRNRMFLLEYDWLTEAPEEALAYIHTFLEQPLYTGYDFSNVRQLIREDDRAYDFPGLHQIRPRVEPNPSQWKDILGDYGFAYEAVNEALYQLINRPREQTVMDDTGPTSGLAEEHPVQAVPSRNHQISQPQKARSAR